LLLTFAFGGPLKGKHAKDVADILLQFIYLFDSPRILHSVNGKEFTNSDLSKVVEDFKTKQIHGRPDPIILRVKAALKDSIEL
jgi:transposase InsO family protein